MNTIYLVSEVGVEPTISDRKSDGLTACQLGHIWRTLQDLNL